MKTQTNKNSKRTVSTSVETTSLKKRPVGPAKLSTSLSTPLKAKDRVKTPIVSKNVKIVSQTKKTPVVEELPPTIAAGRSRRAHKPNPKYANDDILTPRSIKPVVISHFEDDFNKTDNDSEQEDQRPAKATKISKESEIELDSDFDNEDNEEIEDSDTSLYERKTRGRHVRSTADSAVRRSAVGISNAAAIARGAPTQLQQLRRTLNASNVSPLAMGKKRKLEESSSSTTPVNKRPNISRTISKPIDSNGIVKRRQSPSIGSNDSKEKKSSPLSLTRSVSVANLKSVSASKSPQNPLQRGIANRNSLGKVSSVSTPSLSKSSVGKGINASPTSTNITATKARSTLSKASPSNKLPNAAGSKKTGSKSSSSDADDAPTVTIDDFETMPTFTIVNINDIINKKGDVLISEASDKSKTQPDASTKPNTNQSQTQQNKPLAKKQSTVGVKNSQPITSTPLMKRSTDKASNKVVNRNSSGIAKSSPPTQKSTIAPAATRSSTRSAGSNNANDKKPAPRILNSVVSPRTKPIKPVIANLDMSDDDPSGSVSLYTDEEDFDGNDVDDGDVSFKDDISISDSDFSGSEREIVKRKRKKMQPKKSPASTASGKSKVNTPSNAAKENSAAVNNCMPKKQTLPLKQTTTRKLSPEKVVVQREGNKIIKKITCFETWYVINIPADGPEEYERNTLDMPLIDLANSAKAISLPSDKWTTKVTLYELRKSMNKSNLTIYNGDLNEHNIQESDRANYQPSCVMFRRTVPDRVKLQLPYDRAVIFKNKTFFTNIEGKNVKLVGAPTTIKESSEVETLLNIVDGLTLQSPFVEPASTML